MWITHSAAGAGSAALLSRSGRLACFAGGNGDGLQVEHLTPAPADTGREARLIGGDNAEVVYDRRRRAAQDSPEAGRGPP